MKVTVAGSDGFIKKNIVENLKNFRDEKNRTRAGLMIDDVSGDITGDEDAVIMPVTDGSFMDPEEIRADRVIYVFAGGAYEKNGGPVKSKDERILVYRCPEITGKWDESDNIIPALCRSAANDEEYPACDREDETEVLFIDDLMDELWDYLEGKPGTSGKTEIRDHCYFLRGHRVSAGEVMDMLDDFNRLSSSFVVQDIPKGSFIYDLYSLYLSYLPERKMSYPVHMNQDDRGVFTELIRTKNSGQVSVNISRPGITKGQHWHNSKWEIFIVVSGHGLIQEREIGTGKVYSFEVFGEEMRAVIMLPGYTHSITNLEKDRDLVTVMYANEQFDPDRPDTFFEEVQGVR